MTDQVLVLISEYLPTDIPVSYLTLLLLPLAYLRESAPNDKVIKSNFAPREQHLIPSFLSGVSISVIVVIWVYSSLASCFLLFGAYNWMSVVSVSIVDGNISQFFFFGMSADAVSSIGADPYVGSVEEVQSGLNRSEFSGGGMMQSMQVYITI